MPTCVEECLRYVSPVQMTKPRFATRDMTWMGNQLLRGQMVAALLAAANCDPAKFEDEPHRFDIGRHPNPHLSFGTGMHFCLGFQLARAEAAVAFERVFARFPKMRLAVEPRTIEWRRRPKSARSKSCLCDSATQLKRLQDARSLRTRNSARDSRSADSADFSMLKRLQRSRRFHARDAPEASPS